MQIHIWDPQLGPKMVHADVPDSAGSHIKFQDLDGTVEADIDLEALALSL